MFKEARISQQEIDNIKYTMSKGDSRYFDQYNSEIVARFIKNKAIKIVKKEINNKVPIIKEEFNKIQKPQRIDKYFILKYLLSKCCELVGFERLYSGGRADVVMKDKNNLFLIECGPCRISKAINYLRLDNAILILADLDIFTKKLIIHTFKRGKNWHSFLKYYDKQELEALNKIKSPHDELFEID